MDKVMLTVIISVFVLGSFTFVEDSRAMETKIVYVDDDYNFSTSGWGVDCFSKIQDAINATGSGGTIYVYSGIYYENVVVNKSIALFGEDKNNAIIDGGGNGNTVSIVVNNVSISNFTIRNSGSDLDNAGLQVLSNDTIICDNMIVNSSVGIYLQGCSDNIVKGNIVENTLYGVGLRYCNKDNNISGNYVHNSNVTGIYLAHSVNSNVYNNVVENNSYGIALSFSENNNISDNLINNNSRDGLNIYFCNGTVFVRNTVRNGGCGIAFIESNHNIVGENYIDSSLFYGIRLVLESCNNKIYENIISNCDTGVYISFDSTENHLNHNLFSSNNKKIEDEMVVVGGYHSPDFGIILLVIAALIILLKGKVNLRN